MNLGTTQQLHLRALNSLKPAPRPNNVSLPSISTITGHKPAPRAKPPASKAISIQHMTAQKKNISNQRLLYDILNFLREAEKPVTAETIHEHTGQDIKSTPGLMESILANMKISYEEGWFAYKPTYSVKNIHELQELINKTPDGIELEQLKDCYKAAEADVRKLKEQNDAVLIVNVDTKYEVVYPNDPRYRVQIADEFKSMWRQVMIPQSEVDLERDMRAAGIALAAEEEDKGPRKRPSSKKDKKARKRIVKYTNTHILPGSGIDLSKDYVPETKKSSGLG